MECKVHQRDMGLWQFHSINRNIMECKAHPEDFLGIRKEVLIETLWNVK